ncbi:hypothetical protein CPC08DRAFT_754031 [Agrocybe pediades]|nr:hypothetical protein CPC08DRAFT_754031 [Agrocybe pediades]
MSVADIPQVFVDDSDPNIVYSGQDAWVVQTGISTAPQPFILPARAPLYGTIHQIAGEGSLSYIYHGIDVLAIFNSGDNSTFISSCIIDGKQAGRDFQVPGETVFVCTSHDLEAVLQDGEHNITVIVSRNPSLSDILPTTSSLPYFDGLFYTPSNATYVASRGHELDLAYDPSQASNDGFMNMTSRPHMEWSLSVPGDGIDLDFNGTSVAMYVTYMNGDNVPVTLSYNVDGGPAINFTLVNPSTTQSAEDQLILQTPQYAQGQHHFHLDFFGPSSKDQYLYLDYVFVQNAPSTRKLALAPFPPIPSAFPTDKTSTIESTSHHTAPQTIIAITATLPAVLAIFILSMLYIKRRQSLRRKLSSRDGNSPEVTVTPFIPGIFARRLMYPASKRMLASVPDLPRVTQNVSKANQLAPPRHEPTRAALPGPVPSAVEDPAPAPAPVPAPAAAPASPAAEDATEEPIYRIHEDGGSVHEVSSTAPRQRQVIDLPPLYSSNFGRRAELQEDSGAGAQEPEIA